jgi:hypothetical protein
MCKEKFNMEEDCPATIEKRVNPYRIHLHASVDSVISLPKVQYSFHICYSVYLLLNFRERIQVYFRGLCISYLIT